LASVVVAAVDDDDDGDVKDVIVDSVVPPTIAFESISSSSSSDEDGGGGRGSRFEILMDERDKNGVVSAKDTDDNVDVDSRLSVLVSSPSSSMFM
jgi:hypothetical protein